MLIKTYRRDEGRLEVHNYNSIVLLIRYIRNPPTGCGVLKTIGGYDTSHW